MAEGNNLRIAWKWPGVKTADISCRVRFPKRGEFTLPGTAWESQAPFGIRRSGSGGGELLWPESGRQQFRRLTQLLSGLKSGPPRHDLLQSVEWCKGFLFRLQPEVFIITRLDVHYPRPGEAPESLDRLTAAIKRLTALRARSKRPGRVRVMHVSPRGLRSDSPLTFAGVGLAQWESRSLAASLRKSGAAVTEWDPAREDFIAALVRHMDA